SASSALLAKAAAESARDAALTAFDDFDDRYLGAFAAAPATDNDGDPLVAGALYFDTVREAMLIYTGSAWVAAYVSGGGFLAAVNNLADVLSVPAALSNLGLGNVDNTSDADKPVSTAQVAAIAAAKSEVIGGATTAADTLGKAEALLGAKLGADFSVLPELLSPTGSELLAVSDGENSKRIGIGTLVGLASGGGMVLPDAIIKDQKATGVAGQLLTAGVYVKRDLNTVVRNIDGCVSLSSSQITFNASGFVHFLSPAYGCNRHRAALYDVTNGSYVMYGSSEFSSEQSSSEGIVAVLSGHVYELRHRAQVTSYGGVETNDGNNNVYSRVYFWKS
ncbi:MAG TPA: hypothetical protein PLJ34_04875, partial [Hyphomicrobiales bacterium]|nr:hypothetical protein [Hyphomicrobiales bacterium]